MKISEYLWTMAKNFATVCGCMVIFMAIYLQSSELETINTSLFWQIMLLSSAAVFFKFGLVKLEGLSEKAQRISFFVCFFLADIMILLWLFFYTPGGKTNQGLLFSYFIVLVVTKAVVYAMMTHNGKLQAKQLNARLRVYKGGK